MFIVYLTAETSDPTKTVEIINFLSCVRLPKNFLQKCKILQFTVREHDKKIFFFVDISGKLHLNGHITVTLHIYFLFELIT